MEVFECPSLTWEITQSEIDSGYIGIPVPHAYADDIGLFDAR